MLIHHYLKESLYHLHQAHIGTVILGLDLDGIYLTSGKSPFVFEGRLE